MSKTKLGFDIGNSSIKIAVVSDTGIQVHAARMPDNMMDDGEIAMPAAFSDFLRHECKELGLPRAECALALPARQVICRQVTMPRMPVDQLLLNLPYEFSDFTQGDVDRFICDYAMCEDTATDTAADTADGEPQMTMMAAVAAKDRVIQYTKIFAAAGLKLRVLLPGEMALIQLIRQYRERSPESPEEYCFINLGQETVLITIIRKDRVLAMRQIDLGCAQIDQVIADQMNVDTHLAATYKQTNYQDILNTPECTGVYQNIAVEILKVVNFYRFNHRDSELEGVYLTGGGASIAPLCEQIGEMLGMDLLQVSALLPGAQLEPELAAKGSLAIGVAIGQRGTGGYGRKK